jgi:hypothetical protein
LSYAAGRARDADLRIALCDIHLPAVWKRIDDWLAGDMDYQETAIEH